ncbi:MAG: hypothetical protein SFV32_10170 [Opitutaceae bacterium]|nr:hypothetical protein [Opitutaceae bacterium]
MNSQNRDDDVRRAIRAWQVRPLPNSTFRPEVWQRIQQGSDAGWTSYLKRHAASVSLAAILTLVLSGWLGKTASRVALEHQRETMIVSYLVDLDPRVEAMMRNRTQ